MRKILLIILGIIAVLAVALLLGDNLSEQQENIEIQENPAIHAFTQYKKTCKDIGAEKHSYVNRQKSFRFEIPEGMLVCERQAPWNGHGQGVEISVFEREVFFSETGGFGPSVVIHVDEEDIT